MIFKISQDVGYGLVRKLKLMGLLGQGPGWLIFTPSCGANMRGCVHSEMVWNMKI